MAVVTTGEERTASEELREDATNSPNIDRLGDPQQRLERFSGRNTERLTLVYILKDSMISGARYHRVATYSVMTPTSFPAGTLVWMLRAKPKSQTLRSQLALRRRLAGLRSRWTMSAL